MSKVFTGARAKLFVDNVLVGIYDSVSYSINVSAEPIHTLGRFSAVEITPTAYEAVSVNCSGFRVIGNGAHILPKFPKLQDLLKLENVTLSMTDRDDRTTNKPVMIVQNCIPVSYSTGANAKATSRVQITYMGTHHSDEAGNQDESGGASSF